MPSMQLRTMTQTVISDCEKCDECFKEYEDLKVHFLSNHIVDDYIECIVEDCEYETKTVNQLTMHVGVEQYELVKEKL